MEKTYTRIIIYSYLIFGSSVLCGRILEKRQAVSSYSEYTEDDFCCSNGLCIEWSKVCDGTEDCTDGLDENKELCVRWEYGTNMTTDCGRLNINNQVIFEEGRAIAPWNVQIYKYSKTHIGYYGICGGSIIAPNVVISAAQCFDHQGVISNRISVKEGELKVAIGVNDMWVAAFDNNITQIINVETIYLKDSFNEAKLGIDDIAVIVLTNKFSYNNGVAPVCIDWNSIYNVQVGDLGKMVFWRMDEVNTTLSTFYLETSLQYIDPATCKNEFITSGFQENEIYDKLCADQELGKQKQLGLPGFGISFLHSNSYFLTGILVAAHTEPNITELGYTGIKYHVQWIRELLNKHVRQVKVNSCILPTAEGVVYSYEGSNEILSHETLINRHVTVIENCEVGYHKAYTDGFRFCQGKGKWLSNYDKLCFKMCPPLISDSLDIKCSYNGKYANCSNWSIPGTIATPSCKPTFSAPKGTDISLQLLCQSNGIWDKQLYTCDPYCGRVYVKNHVLIENGDQALVGTAPWNTGVYQFNEIDSNYDLICGGSIIAPNLVISAAHCFWQKQMLSKPISVTDGRYKIAVGKYDRNFTIIDNEFTQIMNVEMIHLKPGYYGSTGFHAEDIAIIVLQNRVSFSNGVSPVCIDWSGKYIVVNEDQGKIVGWGETEKGIASPILLEASLSYIDHNSCRSMYTNGFEPFVTFDKFCAGSASVSGYGVGRGDSGAGLCFFHSDSYYLTGVVSNKDPNSNKNIAVFTDVMYHIQWIRELHNKHN